MVDYSKWDKMDFGSSSDEEECVAERGEVTGDCDSEESTGATGVPPSLQDILEANGGVTVRGTGGTRVTKLARPTSVTFGGKEAAPRLSDPAATAVGNTLDGVSLDDDTLEFNKWCRNGGINGDVFAWSQSPEEVTVYVFVPLGLPAKSIQVALSNEAGLVVKSAEKTYVQGLLAFEIDNPEDEYDIDWEVLDVPRPDPSLFPAYIGVDGRPAADGDGRAPLVSSIFPGRAIRVSMKKKAVPGGISVIVWWNRILKVDAPIDVTKLPDRKKLEETQKVWREAHKIFEQTKHGPRETTVTE